MYHVLQNQQKNENDDQNDPGANPKWHRTSLALFPATVLKEMTQCLNGFALLTLYQCGSGLLNYKLRKIGAVTQFSVRYGLDHTLPYRDWRNNNFRSIALFQSLRSLEFLGFAHRSFRNFTTAIIATIAPILEVLRFDFIESWTMWIDLCPSSYGVDKLDYATLRPKPFHLDAQFPNLKILSLSSHCWDRYSIYPSPKTSFGYNWTEDMKDEFISHIPRYLIEYEAGGVIPQDFLAGLPSEQLMKLSLSGLPYGRDFRPLPNREEASLEISRGLPRELVSLTLSSVVADLRGSDDYPPNLKSLTLQFYADEGPQSDELMATSYFQLPSLLEHLTIRSPCSWLYNTTIEALPRNLTFLDVPKLTMELDDSCVALLPRTLTFLRFGEELADKANTAITPAGLLDLPKCIQTLTFASKLDWPWSALEYFPPSLTRIYHAKFVYESTPDKENASSREATRYWKDKLLPSCRLVFGQWEQQAEDQGARPDPIVADDVDSSGRESDEDEDEE